MGDPTEPEGQEPEGIPAEPAEPSSTSYSQEEEPFERDRAMNTIKSLRAREKELSRYEKELEALRSDPDRFRQFARETHGWDLVDDDPEPEPSFAPTVDDDPFEEVRSEIKELREWKAEKENQEALSQFTEHVESLAKEAEIPKLSKFEKDALLHQSLANGFNPEATQAAFEALMEYRASLGQETVEQWKQSKRAPSVPSGGQSATQVPNLDNEKERQEYMKERAAQLARGD